MNHRLACLSIVVCGLLAAPAVAQDEAQGVTQGKGKIKVEAAVEAWLASDHTSEELLDTTVKVVLADQKRGIGHVAKLLAGSAGAPSAPRTKGIKALATHLSLAFLRRESSGSVIFAGQYLPLEPLQPFAGELFFSLLIDTPNWYPDTHRIQLIPVLRDLQPTLPNAAHLEGVIEIAENEAIEPENLRSALGCMLWQWGKTKYVQPRIDGLVRSSTEGEIEDRVRALIELADLYYALRDYKISAATHRSLQSLATNTRFELKPVDYYSAACVHALCGEIDRGIESLAKCVELQASDEVDSSHKVERETFENDPEIGALRAHPRFAAIMAKALKYSPKAVSRRR